MLLGLSAAITSLDELGDCVSGTNSVESEIEKRHIERTIDKFLWRQSEEKRNVFIMILREKAIAPTLKLENISTRTATVAKSCFILLEAMTEEQFIENGLDFTAYRYILATSNKTYVLHYASDVQYDPENEEQKIAYIKMMSEIKAVLFSFSDSA